MKKRTLTTLILAGASLLTGTSHADIEHCPIISVGAETTLPGSYHNIGQMVIGISTNATTIAHHGGLACLRVHTTCLLGDVDGNGLINGEDIDDFVGVKLTGAGTPRELCSANITYAQFVGLLLTF